MAIPAKYPDKQATKRNRYSVLSSFYNFSINTALPALTNPCNTAVIKKIFRRPQAIQWQIVDKETVDEIIFRTMNIRNRLMLELMARGGMRIGEVLGLTTSDIQENSLTIQKTVKSLQLRCGNINMYGSFSIL
jgi:integrase